MLGTTLAITGRSTVYSSALPSSARAAGIFGLPACLSLLFKHAPPILHDLPHPMQFPYQPCHCLAARWLPRVCVYICARDAGGNDKAVGTGLQGMVAFRYFLHTLPYTIRTKNFGYI